MKRLTPDEQRIIIEALETVCSEMHRHPWDELCAQRKLAYVLQRETEDHGRLSNL